MISKKVGESHRDDDGGAQKPKNLPGKDRR